MKREMDSILSLNHSLEFLLAARVLAIGRSQFSRCIMMDIMRIPAGLITILLSLSKLHIQTGWLCTNWLPIL
jgi:hypothetical protein